MPKPRVFRARGGFFADCYESPLLKERRAQVFDKVFDAPEQLMQLSAWLVRAANWIREGDLR